LFLQTTPLKKKKRNWAISINITGAAGLLAMGMIESSSDDPNTSVEMVGYLGSMVAAIFLPILTRGIMPPRYAPSTYAEQVAEEYNSTLE